MSKVVYLSEAQLAELIEEGTITANGVTVEYSEDDLYITPNEDVGVTDVTWDGSNKQIKQSINNETAAPIVEFEAGENITLTANSTKLIIAASDTNNAVTQTATTTNSAYEILFSGTADNTTRTEGARKTSTLKYNPSTKTLTIGSGTALATLTPTNYSGKAATAGTADSANSVALANITNATNLQSIEAISETSGFLQKTAENTWQLNSIVIPNASSIAPQDLANTAASGSSSDYARADHVHKLPSLSDLGAASAAAVITDVAYDTTNKKITKTNDNTTTDILEFEAGNNITLTGAANKITIAANNEIPSGGTTGQALVKNSNTDGDIKWDTISGLPSGGSVGQVLTKNSSADQDASWSTINSVPSNGSNGDILTKTSNGYEWITPSGDNSSRVYAFSFSIESSNWTEGQDYTYSMDVPATCPFTISNGTYIFMNITSGYNALGADLTADTGNNIIEFSTTIQPTTTITGSILLVENS